MAKNRLKKNSILNFVAVAVLTVIGIVLSVCSFIIPYTNGSTYNGFANSVSLGFDLTGGISVVYDCSLSEDSTTSNLDTAISETVEKLKNMIDTDVDITRQGDTQIRIEGPNTTEFEETIDLITNSAPLRMTLEEGGEALIVGTDIASVYVSYQSSYGVVINFTTSGTTKFAELTAEAAESGSNIYIYLGDTSGDYLTYLTCSEEITTGTTFISGDSWTYDNAQAYATQIICGTLNVSFELNESNIVSAPLGENALTFFLIGLAVGLVLVLITMWLRYGEFSFLAFFATVIYIVLMLFFLQAISIIQLSLSGLLGVILSLIILFDGFVIIFEKIREDYRSGKKIPTASRNGFKRAFWPVFDSNIIAIVTSILLYVLGTSSIQSFAIILLVGTALSMFTNLVILRFFVKWYLPFNSVKPNKLHLPKQVKPVKDEQVVEIIAGGDVNE